MPRAGGRRIVSDAKRDRRRERRDDASLRDVRARRTLTPPGERPERGAYYVVPGHEDDPFQVHWITPSTVVLRSRSGGFLTFDASSGHVPESAWWSAEIPRRTPAEVRAALDEHDARRRRP